MEDKKSLKEKLKAHLPHKKGAEKKQTGTEDTGFTIRLDRIGIHCGLHFLRGSNAVC